MKKYVNESSDFEKRLIGYSTMASAMLVIAPILKGEVHRTVVNQTNLQVYNFDVNNDATTNFRLSQYSTGFGGYCLSQWRGRGVEGATAGYSAVMNSGSLIGPSRNFINGNLVKGTKGPWGGVSNKYLGIRVDLDYTAGTEYHYVWVKLSVNASPYRFDLHEYAWEDIEDLPIVAGSDVSLPVQLTEFSAVLGDGGVKLTWTTDSESDILGFILERQAVGESEWLKITSYETNTALNSQGNTSARTEYAFTDENVFTGQTFHYRLSYVDMEGKINIYDVIEIFVTDEVIPEKTILKPAMPNPFNPSTKIAYKLAEDSKVTLSVIDLMGRTVKTIISGRHQTAGSHSIHWNGNTDTGQNAANGIYLLVLKAGGVMITQKVVLLR